MYDALWYTLLCGYTLTLLFARRGRKRAMLNLLVLQYSVFSIGNPKEIADSGISLVNPIQIDQVAQKCQK